MNQHPVPGHGASEGPDVPEADGTVAPKLLLRLYVNGEGPLTAAVEQNLASLGRRLRLTYQLEIVDVVADPATAERDRVVVTPTLMRLGPPPQLRVAGDLSDMDAALDGLGLRVWEQSGD